MEWGVCEGGFEIGNGRKPPGDLAENSKRRAGATAQGMFRSALSTAAEASLSGPRHRRGADLRITHLMDNFHLYALINAAPGLEPGRLWLAIALAQWLI